MRVDLDIPGGPISVVLTGVETDAHSARGWWTVGGRKLLCARHLDGPWTLTGRGLPARRSKADAIGLPPKSMRDAFRRFLLSCCRAGDVVSPYSLDNDAYSSPISWGWSDSNAWVWRTRNDGRGTLIKADAVRWMRAQGAKVGVQIREEGDPE